MSRTDMSAEEQALIERLGGFDEQGNYAKAFEAATEMFSCKRFAVDATIEKGAEAYLRKQRELSKAEIMGLYQLHGMAQQEMLAFLASVYDDSEPFKPGLSDDMVRNGIQLVVERILMEELMICGVPIHQMPGYVWRYMKGYIHDNLAMACDDDHVARIRFEASGLPDTFLGDFGGARYAREIRAKPSMFDDGLRCLCDRVPSKYDSFIAECCIAWMKKTFEL